MIFSVILRLLAIACAGTIIAIAVLSIIFSGTANLQYYISWIYDIIFGVLILLSELRINKLLYWFAFLKRKVGVGIFYIFVVFFVVDNRWWDYLVGAVLFTIGLIHIITGLTNCNLLGQGKTTST
jgi:hypothetical protein